MRTRIAIAGLFMAACTPLLADTLVLTNGRRVQGELTGVHGREIEFEERTGGRRRTIRVDRNEIARIEFDDPGSFFGGGRDDDRRDNRANDIAGGIPRGMRERQINVTAREPWTDTGIDVRPGQAMAQLKAAAEKHYRGAVTIGEDLLEI
jgi:hypothetical protein